MNKPARDALDAMREAINLCDTIWPKLDDASRVDFAARMNGMKAAVEKSNSIFKADLLTMAGDATELEGDNFRAKFAEVVSTRIDVERFRDEQPKLAQKYSVSSTSVRTTFAAL